MDVGSLLKDADKAADRNDMAGAIESWRRAIEIADGSVSEEVYRSYAKALRETRDLEEAKVAISQGLDRYPNDLGLLVEQGHLLDRIKDWPAAAEVWARVIAAHGIASPPTALVRYAHALRMIADLDSAEKVILEATKRRGKSRAVWYEAAEIATARGASEDAADRWRQYFDVFPKGTPTKGAYARRATSATARGAWKYALDLWRRYFNAIPSEPEIAPPARAYKQRAMAELAANRHVGAAATIAEGKRHYPDDIDLLNADEALLVVRRRPARKREPSRLELPDGIGVKRVCECFWDIEKKYDLVDWQVNGVYAWPLMRMHIYYDLAQRLSLYDAPHPAHVKFTKERAIDGRTGSAIKSVLDYCRGGEVPSGKLPGSRPSNVVPAAVRLPERSEVPLCDSDLRHAVLTTPRKVGGNELYTEALRVELGDRAMLLDRPLGHALMAGALSFDELASQFQLHFRKARDGLIRADDRILCADVAEHFLCQLGCSIGDLATRCQHSVTKFNSVRAGFRALFELNPVETFFLTNAYTSTIRAALAGAQDCGIKTVELQHGFISRFHLGYSWPERNEVPYTPDELWCFGDYWEEVTPLPANVKARTIGAPYVKRLGGEARVQRQPNLVVFTSQGVIGHSLLKIAIETARRRPDKEIVFRLHPNEVLDDYAERVMEQDAVPDNFSLSHRDPNIFKLLAKASIQVGAFSTTLLEGMVLGVRAVVVDLPGAEYMLPVIERGDALFVADTNELVERLDDAPLAEDPEYYYAAPASPLLT